MLQDSPRNVGQSTRRNFLKRSTVAVVGTSALGSLAVPSAVHAAGTSTGTLKIGLVGCGGRGTGAAKNAMEADNDCKLVALGDAFEDRLNQSKRGLSKNAKYGVDDAHCFVGFDSFKKVIDCVDVVVLATPPHFRPEHYRYAVEAGKHLFVEKPVAVDAPGIRHVMETNEMAKKKGLSVVSGLCWRYDHGVRETIRRVKEGGMIGDITAIQSDYLASTLWHRGDKPQWSRMEYQMRNWLYYTWLSGDHCVEQHIHSLDKVMWLMDDKPPVNAVGLGGRIQRTGKKFGNAYDHFTGIFEFENGLHAHTHCRQQKGCTTGVDEYVTGTKGYANILANRIWTHDGQEWKYDGPKPSMYVAEHQELFASIRKGEPIQNGDYMATSTMFAIMDRMVGYTGKKLTWEQCINSTERLGPTTYEWGDMPEPEVAIPGETKFV